MSLYYQDDHVTLYHGDCLEILPTLTAGTDTHLITDPPYFKVKNEAWDNQWKKPEAFLSWMGEWMDLVRPALSANASIWVFTSPQLNTAVERVVDERFRVLNNVRWIKPQGWHNKADPETLRSFLTDWEGIIFAEQYANAYGDAATALHRQVFAPMGRYLQTEWERAGMKAGQVGKALGYDSALPVRWAEGSSLPARDAYQRLRDLLNRQGGEYLRREYEDLRREYEDLRRPFALHKTTHNTDTWTFDTVPPSPDKHPCEKPLALMQHIISTTTRENDTVLDPFAGSGSTLAAARNLGRKSIGIEMNEHYCEIIAKRLAQDVLPLGV